MTQMHIFDWLAPGDHPTVRQLDCPKTDGIDSSTEIAAVQVLAAATAPAWLAYSLAERRALDEWMLERWGPRFASA